jgi:hypothetical protein
MYENKIQMTLYTPLALTNISMPDIMWVPETAIGHIYVIGHKESCYTTEKLEPSLAQ